MSSNDPLVGTRAIFGKVGEPRHWTTVTIKEVVSGGWLKVETPEGNEKNVRPSQCMILHDGDDKKTKAVAARFEKTLKKSAASMPQFVHRRDDKLYKIAFDIDGKVVDSDEEVVAPVLSVKKRKTSGEDESNSDDDATVAIATDTKPEYLLLSDGKWNALTSAAENSLDLLAVVEELKAKYAVNENAPSEFYLSNKESTADIEQFVDSVKKERDKLFEKVYEDHFNDFRENKEPRLTEKKCRLGKELSALTAYISHIECMNDPESMMKLDFIAQQVEASKTRKVSIEKELKKFTQQLDGGPKEYATWAKNRAEAIVARELNSTVEDNDIFME